MNSMSKLKLVAGSILTLVIVSFAVFGLIRWSAIHTLEQTAAELDAENNLKFSANPYTVSTETRFVWTAAPVSFRHAVFFQGYLYICGPSGLFAYQSDGKLVKQYRAGRELPASPVITATVGTLPDGHAPELILATSREGILAFDGNAFRQILPIAPTAREITAILATASGRLLIGTEKKGVLVYDGKQLHALHPELAGFHVTQLAGDDMDLWIGTQNRGVFHWHGGQVDNFDEASGLPDPQITSIALHGQQVFIGTALGIAQFDHGQFTRKLADGELIQSLLVHGNKLLVGTWNNGLMEASLISSKVTSSRTQVTQLMEADPISQIFTGTKEDDSLYALSKGGLYQSSTSNNSHAGWKKIIAGEDGVLTDGNISALNVDKEGKLWVGYFDRGLDVFSSTGKKLRHVEDEHVFCVNRLVQDAKRNLMLAATANGLVMLDTSGSIQQILTHVDGLIADHVTDVALTSGGGMTLATPAGLTFIDASGPRSLYAFHGLVNNHVYALGSSGRTLMAGTLGGISMLNDDQVRVNYTTANSTGLKHNWITAIVPVDNEWMVGTYGAGVLRLNTEGHFESMETGSGKFEVNPNAMLVTQDHVFTGSLDRGLFVFNRKTGRWTVMTSGLPSLNITALATDGDQIFVGTENGLVRISERKLD